MFTIHQRNIQSLAIELFKVKGNLSNNIMYDIFQTRKINYNLGSQTDFASICVNTKKISLKSMKHGSIRDLKFWMCRNIQNKNSKCFLKLIC